jgi:hypothetical protein
VCEKRNDDRPDLWVDCMLEVNLQSIHKGCEALEHIYDLIVVGADVLGVLSETKAASMMRFRRHRALTYRE